jgi:hypothetical protein
MMTVTPHWVNILEREGWLLINVNERKLGIIISITEVGKVYLKIAGFHLGESMLVGERKNILSVKVEPIPADKSGEMLHVIKAALPAELQELPIAFL